MARMAKKSLILLSSFALCLSGIFTFVVGAPIRFPSIGFNVKPRARPLPLQDPDASSEVIPLGTMAGLFKPHFVAISAHVNGVDKLTANSTAKIVVDQLSISQIIPHEQQFLQNARAHLTDGSLSIRFNMPGATVAPEESKLFGRPIAFLVRSKDNEEGYFQGSFELHSSAKNMIFYLDSPIVGMRIQKSYTMRDSVSWYYTFLGSGFTLCGLLGFLSSRFLPKDEKKSEAPPLRDCEPETKIALRKRTRKRTQ